MDGFIGMMDKKKLKEILTYEKTKYFSHPKKVWEAQLRHTKPYAIWQTVEALRKYEYRCAKRDATKNPILYKWQVLLVRLADRKRNLTGEKLGIELMPGRVNKGLRICHDNVILNGYVGEDCTFHGNNVLGNKKTGDSEAVPHLGNRVDVGVGAIVIGDVTIADDCIIGAGALVTKSFLTPGTVIVGSPARALK